MERVLADAAICFANTAGGIIIVGVCDKKKGIEAITGTNLDPDRVKQRIYELSRPHLNVEVTRHPDHENLLLIFVPQSSDIHSDTQGRAYHWINLDCLPMTPDQQARLREERKGIDWTSFQSEKEIKDVSPEAIAAARPIYRTSLMPEKNLANLSNEDLLSALGATSSRQHLNRAGALMFCNPDADQSPTIVYQYRATPGGEPKTVQRLGTPLVLSFLRTMELVGARQTLTPVTMPSGQQITIEDFPSLAVREAISNAICHRDYHLNGPVVVEHSPDVFIVTSPGPLVSGVTTSNIITTTSRPRNPALAKVARVLGLAEELGRGIDRMYREMIRSGRQLPRIDAEFDRVRVTLVGGAPDTQIARFIASLPQDEREDTDTMLVLYRLCSSKTITAALAAPLLQKTPEEAEAILKRLSTDAIALLEPTRATKGRSAPAYRFGGGAEGTWIGCGLSKANDGRNRPEGDRSCSGIWEDNQ